MTMSDLKPCPFCGSEAVLNHGHMITATGQYLANVKCSECGIATRVVWSTDSPEEAVKESIEAWNKRVVTDTNDGSKERTAKVRDWSEDEFGHYRCDKCGFVLESDYVYCPNCGARLEWK